MGIVGGAAVIKEQIWSSMAKIGLQKVFMMETTAHQGLLPKKSSKAAALEE